MKKIIIIGNVIKEPELRYDPDGTMYSLFSVLLNDVNSNHKYKEWIDISYKHSIKEIDMIHLQKAEMVLIEGIPLVGAYINKAGNPIAVLRVCATNIEIFDDKLIEHSDDNNEPSLF